MKDKLVKTGRKGLYYKARRLFLASLLFATFAATITVTTIMTVTGGAVAEEGEVTEVVESSDSEVLLL